MYRGSCLCGTVSYELRGELGPVVQCHCSRCRKAQGSAYATNSPVKEADFHLLSGQESLRDFESSPGKFRTFCSRCGSPVYSRALAKPGILRLRIGLLDTPLSVRPVAHIFASSHAEWDVIRDDLPQYEAGMPG